MQSDPASNENSGSLLKLLPPVGSSTKTTHPPIKRHLSRALLFNSNLPGSSSPNKPPLSGSAAAAAVVSEGQHSSSGVNSLPPTGRRIQRMSSMTFSDRRTLNHSVTFTGKGEEPSSLSVSPRAGSYTGPVSVAPRSGSFTGGSSAFTSAPTTHSSSGLQRSLSRLGSRVSRGLESDYNGQVFIEEGRWTVDGHHMAMTWDDEGRVLAMQVNTRIYSGMFYKL